MGMTRSLAPFSSHNICQGTILEWCSIAEMTISSPAFTFLRPQELLTRFMPSVVPRTKISSSLLRAFRKRLALERVSSYAAVERCDSS